MKKIFGILLTLICLMGLGLSFNGVEAATETDQTNDAGVLISSIASQLNWVNGTKYTSFNYDENITISVTGGNNTGKYYTIGNDWRLYQNESPKLIVSAKQGYAITDIIISYTTYNTGILLDANNNVVSSDTTVSGLDNLTYTFSVGNSKEETKGQVRITKIIVSYVTSAIKYSMTFDSDGGTLVNAIETKENTTFTKPTDPTKESSKDFHYCFVGWYEVNEDGTLSETPYDFSTLATKNVILKAKWNEVAKSSYEMFSYVNVLANISLDFKDRVVQTTKTTIVLSDCFTLDANLIDDKNTAKVNELKDDISLTLVSTTNSSLSNYNSTNKHIRIYAGTVFKIENTATTSFSAVSFKCESYAYASVIALNNANDGKVLVSGDICTIELSSPSTSITLEAGNQTRITEITVSYGSVEKATNFTNVSMQFKYDFSFGKYDDITESGFILTTDSNLIKTLKGLEDSSVANVNGEMDKVNQSKKIVKSNNLNTFIYGVTFVQNGSKDYSYCKENFYVVAYIIVGGKYYFSNELNDGLGYSVQSIIEKYSSTIDKDVTQDIILALSDFSAEIESFNQKEN